MRIRPLAEADAEALPSLVAGLNEAMGDPVGAFTAAHARAHILAPGAALRCLVAEEGGALIGYAFWHFAYESAYAAPGGHVSDLFVAEPARGRGVGEALLSAVAAAIRAEGGEYFWLTTLAPNHAARGFYRSRLIETEGVVAYALVHDDFADWAERGGAA